MEYFCENWIGMGVDGVLFVYFIWYMLICFGLFQGGDIVGCMKNMQCFGFGVW